MVLPTVDPLSPWRSPARPRPVSPEAQGHVIHSYFNACPESPDGSHVLYYVSSSPEGHRGEIRVLERVSGQERTLAREVNTEDAHRAACQQWSQQGRKVVFHDLREGHWVVVAVDLESGKENILARDRQLGFGSPHQDWVPLYGCHWNPGPHRDLELVHVGTGEIRKVVRIADVAAAHSKWVAQEFGTREISVFFPVMSPDGKRIFFKMAAGNGGDDFRSPKASHREGMIVYDLEAGLFLNRFDRWGHPSWHPDSKRIFEAGNVLVSSATGEVEPCGPPTQSDHPSFDPTGRLFVTDGKVLAVDHPKPAEWGIVIACPETNAYVLVDRFDNSRGAQSWRRNHPHPIFSHDGQRVYYNVSQGEWTQLHVVEAHPVS